MSYKYIVFPNGDVKYNPQFTIDDAFYLNKITLFENKNFIQELDDKIFLKDKLLHYYVEYGEYKEDWLIDYFYDINENGVIKGSIVGENNHGVGQYKIFYEDHEIKLNKTLLEGSHDTISFNKNDRTYIDIQSWEFDCELNKIYKHLTTHINDLDFFLLAHMFNT